MHMQRAKYPTAKHYMCKQHNTGLSDVLLLKSKHRCWCITFNNSKYQTVVQNVCAINKFLEEHWAENIPTLDFLDGQIISKHTIAIVLLKNLRFGKGNQM